MRTGLITAGLLLTLTGFAWGQRIFIPSTKFSPMVNIGGEFWSGGWGVVVIWRDNTGFAAGYNGNVGWRFVTPERS